jgi:hypothetical protein
MPECKIRHPLKWWGFYWECLRFATGGAWGRSGDASLLASLALPAWKALSPVSYAAFAAYLSLHHLNADILSWKLPLWVGGTILGLRILSAPFFIYRGKPSAPPSGGRDIDTVLHLAVNDDQLRAFCFENFGDDPAFSATARVQLDGASHLEVAADGLVRKGRPEPASVYLVSGERRELVHDYDLKSTLHAADISIGRELQNEDKGHHLIFALTGTGECEFAVSTSFIDKYRRRCSQEHSHRMFFERDRDIYKSGVRFELTTDITPQDAAGPLAIEALKHRTELLASENSALKSQVTVLELDAPRHLSENTRNDIMETLTPLLDEWIAKSRVAQVGVFYALGNDCAQYAMEYSDLFESIGFQVLAQGRPRQYSESGVDDDFRRGIAIMDCMPADRDRFGRPAFADALHEALTKNHIEARRLDRNGAFFAIFIGAKP